MILGLAGVAGSGKDTAAGYLSKNYGFKQIAFADNLKQMCQWVFGLTKDQCYDQKKKESKFANPIMFGPDHVEKIVDYATRINGYSLSKEQIYTMYKYVGNLTTFKTPRGLLQFVGTEVLREIIDEDYHVNVVKRRIDKDRDEDSVYVITDARFENERAKIKEWGGITVYVDRGSKQKKKEVGLKGHASENSLGDTKEYDFTLNNKGSLAKLSEKVDELVDFLNANYVEEK